MKVGKGILFFPGTLHHSRKLVLRIFFRIVGVDQKGIVFDIQHVDFGLIEDLDYMRKLNDQTLETFKSSNPDIGLIAAHCEYFNNYQISTNKLGGEIGQHVGDPDFVGYD